MNYEEEHVSDAPKSPLLNYRYQKNKCAQVKRELENSANPSHLRFDHRVRENH